MTVSAGKNAGRKTRGTAMKIETLLIAALSLLILGACATSPSKIQPAYVSPLKYRDYNCDQVADEMDYVAKRTNRLHEQLEKDAKGDKWQMGVGMLLFLPTLFALEGGDGPEATEYAQLLGEFEALRTVSVEKKCGVEHESLEAMVIASEQPAEDAEK